MHPFTLSVLRNHNAIYQQKLKEEGALLDEWEDLKDCNACGTCYKCFTDKNNNIKNFKLRTSRNTGTILDKINKKKEEKRIADMAPSLIEYRPKKEGGRSYIMNDIMISNLIARFPLYLRQTNWRRLYRRNEDGCSLITFFKNVKEYETTIIVIKDTKGWVFGGFCTEPWK